MDILTARLFHLSKSLSNTKSLKQIQTLHQKAISFGLQNNIPICKNLINLYISCGAYRSAKLVFRNIETPLDITLWNGLMAAYAKNSMFAEAFSLFENLLQFPYLKPDSYTYPSLLKACGGLRRVDYGEKIHTHLIKTGFLSDVVIASSLTSVYAKCGVFGSAVKLFDEMPQRDLPCWNNVISCYYQSGQWEKALEYFESMKSIGLRPDSVSFTTAISACARLLDLEKGKKIHNEVLSKGLLMDAYVSATLVDMYGKCGCLEKATEVFDEIKNKCLVSWNAMIGGYSQIGDSASCIGLLVRMYQNKVKPSSTTISSLLVACAKSAQLRHGRFIHGYIIRNGVFTDIFVENSLLDFYFKCGDIAFAEKVFRKKLSKPDIVAWNVMISGYVSAGYYFEALGMYDEMRAKGIKPDAITITSALAACSQLAALERGKEFHKYINENRLNSNEVVMGALLDMYAKCGAVKEAVSIFSQLPTKDLVSWTSMIVAYGSHGQAFDALKVFDEMLQRKVKPDRVTFLAVISACGHAGLVNEGRNYFNSMVNEYKIRPTIAEYSCLVDLLCRAGRLNEAYEVVQENSFIKEDVDLLSTLFAACHLHGELVLGEKVANILVEKGPDDPSTYVVLEKMYAATKKWDEVRKVRFKMKELGLRKNPGCSWIEVDKRIQSFLADDKMFAQVESVYGCLSIMYGHMEKDKMVAL
ncbi:pentatricopeptide repeat-containing protein at5g27110 [Phtheirospermum japonicum]|uniref:Pentatricopeptide repeat-containing protein at5g27110 n=1 Tax=Phtheirospermum japonicum TaxID=374723 RepID=A0A830BSL7_9LAMI|nr:pentatricopeptide repeat-containing protein at5g27110 [Phtheirospermum japonicum]